jgi:hypothetical protein
VNEKTYITPVITTHKNLHGEDSAIWYVNGSDWYSAPIDAN